MLLEAAVHAWYLPLAEVPQRLFGAYEALLDDAERDRAARFVHERDRRQYVAAHALLRVMLSGHADRPPSSWRFRLQPWGKPEIETGLTPLPLRFSLSHARGMAACAVTLRRDLGLDVEAIDRPLDDMAGVAAFFSAEEIAWLQGCEPAQRHAAFFEIWTLKEAILKATGRGLSLPLDRFGVAPRPPRLLFGPSEWGGPRAWQFRLLRPEAGHQLALAAQEAEDRPLAFDIWRVDPVTLRPASPGPAEPRRQADAPS